MTPDAKRSAKTGDASPNIQATTPALYAFENNRPAGLVRNARVVTARGLRKVQDLQAGDLLIARNSGLVPVRRVERKSLVARAVYIIAGSLGQRKTDRDTLLPEGQAILLRDWRARAFAQSTECLAQAGSLTDGEFVRDIGLQPMTLYQIFCDRPEVIYADGMELGTLAIADTEVS